MTRALVLAALIVLAGCAAVNQGLKYPVLGSLPSPGDTVLAVNARTQKWQRCVIDSSYRIRFIGEPIGKRLDAGRIR